MEKKRDIKDDLQLHALRAASIEPHPSALDTFAQKFGSGAFDAAAFDTALNDARKNVAFGYAVYPGLLWAVAITVAIQLDLYHELLDSAADKSAELQRSWQTYGPAPFLLPAPVVYLLATGAKGGGLAEANMRADDAIWIEKMRAKRAGKAVDD